MSEPEALKALLRGHEPPWPQMERTLGGIWALAARPTRDSLEATGTPAALRNHVEQGLETLSLAAMRERDPYSNPAQLRAELNDLAAGGWIDATDEDAYRISARALANVAAALQAGDAHLATPDVLPEADLERYAALLERLVRAGAALESQSGRQPLAGPAPADTDARGLVRIRALGMELMTRRNEGHRLAWQPLEVTGEAWNAFTLIWRGDARNAVEVAALQPWRGYTSDVYAAAIATLVDRGWLAADTIAGRYRSTTAGDELREAVEVRTDLYFYAPWTALDDDEWNELEERQSALRARLHELRRSGGIQRG